MLEIKKCGKMYQMLMDILNHTSIIVYTKGEWEQCTLLYVVHTMTASVLCVIQKLVEFIYPFPLGIWCYCLMKIYSTFLPTFIFSPYAYSFIPTSL